MIIMLTTCTMMMMTMTMMMTTMTKTYDGEKKVLQIYLRCFSLVACSTRHHEGGVADRPLVTLAPHRS